MLSNDAGHAASCRQLAAVLPIPLGVGAPAAARSFIAGQVGRVAPALLDNALLLVSELVTNSVRHSGAAAGDDVIVRVRALSEECWLEVEDSGHDGVVAPHVQARGAASGFGLSLVDLLSDEWGVVRGPEGPTRVWASMRPEPTNVVVERVSAYAAPDPGADIELARAHGRASRGDSSWLEWLDDHALGRAMVAQLQLEVTLSVAGATRRVTANAPGVWLELDPHPPLVERQVQEAAAVNAAMLGPAIGLSLGVSVPESELASMSVHVELDRAIRDLLPTPAARPV